MVIPIQLVKKKFTKKQGFKLIISSIYLTKSIPIQSIIELPEING